MFCVTNSITRRRIKNCPEARKIESLSLREALTKLKEGSLCWNWAIRSDNYPKSFLYLGENEIGVEVYRDNIKFIAYLEIEEALILAKGGSKLAIRKGKKKIVKG